MKSESAELVSGLIRQYRRLRLLYLGYLAAAVLALGVLIFHRDGSFSALGETNWLYMLGGVLGLVITLTVMLGMHALTPATAVSIILVSQLLTAGAIDALGLMGTERVPLTWSKALGAALMIAGVIIFKR